MHGFQGIGNIPYNDSEMGQISGDFRGPMIWGILKQFPTENDKLFHMHFLLLKKLGKLFLQFFVFLRNTSLTHLSSDFECWLLWEEPRGWEVPAVSYEARSCLMHKIARYLKSSLCHTVGSQYQLRTRSLGINLLWKWVAYYDLGSDRSATVMGQVGTMAIHHLFDHLELGLTRSRAHDSDTWTSARCINKWLSPSYHLTVTPLFQPTTIYEHFLWPVNSRKKRRRSPSMDLLNILSWAEKEDNCHNKASFIVLKNSSKGKSSQGATSVWRDKLSDVKIYMWSWAEVKVLVVGQTLGKTRLETNHVNKSYVDASLRIGSMCLWPRSLYGRGGTQQSGWKHDYSILVHPISCTLVPGKGRVIITDAQHINPATWAFWHGLSWLPLKFKSRVSLVCCSIFRTHLPTKFKIWLAL